MTTDVSDAQAICNDISNIFIDKKDSFFVHLDPLDKIISTIKSAPSKNMPLSMNVMTRSAAVLLMVLIFLINLLRAV